MALLTLMDAQLAFGHVALLDHADFSLEAGERVGLIGRNGTGKSSLLKILAGLETPDDGTLHQQQALRVAYVPQEPALDAASTVFDAVAQPLAPLRALIEHYSRHGDEAGAHAATEAHASAPPAKDRTPPPSPDQAAAALDALQSQIEAQGGWDWAQRVRETLQRLQLDGQALVGTLSGGTQKRVALAQGLVMRPDVLLLDEPTNHLDLDAIEWLEQLLLDFRGSVVVITHDRTFLDKVATRIVELDRGQLRSYPGHFSQYQQQKQEQLTQEATLAARADKLLAQEEVWIRKGVEARRTRAVARINRLQALRQQRAERREALGRVTMAVDAGLGSGYQGKIVAELQAVSKAFDTAARPPAAAGGDAAWNEAGASPSAASSLALSAAPPTAATAPANTPEPPSAPPPGPRIVVNRFSTTVLRGDKVGLVGPNGAGKTTLLKLILGELAPDSGTVRRGANLSVAYFDQMRAALDLDATLEDFISPGSEWIEIGGKRQHVKSYLGDFLFSPARAASPVRSLSGGERNRLLLARLFARPANVLVLDEPTNDLDIDTLELLEDLLQSYEGTVFLVSHDRRFLDNVATSIIASEASPQQPGFWREYEGSVTDWLTQWRRSQALKATPDTTPDTTKTIATTPANTCRSAQKTTPAAQPVSHPTSQPAYAPQATPAPESSPPSHSAPASAAPSPASASAPRRVKLSYKEQRELEALPAQLAALEAEQTAIEAELQDGSLYASDHVRAAQLAARLVQVEQDWMAGLERLEALQAR